MPRPIDAAASLTQSQNALELVQTAQRLAQLAQQRQQVETEKTKVADKTQVTKDEEAQGKTIRDDDPRQGRRRKRKLDEELGHEKQDDPPQHVDIVV